jgi:hypothetical protein
MRSWFKVHSVGESWDEGKRKTMERKSSWFLSVRNTPTYFSPAVLLKDADRKFRMWRRCVVWGKMKTEK